MANIDRKGLLLVLTLVIAIFFFAGPLVVAEKREGEEAMRPFIIFQ